MKRSNLTCLLVLLFGVHVWAQNGEVVPLSPKVGLTVDAEENRYYQVFPDIRGFESAQFFDEGNGRITARILWVDHGRRRLTRRTYSLQEFTRMGTAVSETPAPDTWLSVESPTENIPPVNTLAIRELPLHQWVRLRTGRWRWMHGRIGRIEGSNLILQKSLHSRTLPVSQIWSVTVLDSPPPSYWIPVVYALSGALIAGIFDRGSRWAGATGDRRWYHRFTGFSLGLCLGVWWEPRLALWILPHHQYNIRL
ncbi:MAG: hypothetical protein D6762_03945 [Candidatus Neomarinimicrobiota bacterium]|nr:MAG: hypothetical protein D6762_03945 [Candidatus Neomarinimicrobiota bacterium]